MTRAMETEGSGGSLTMPPSDDAADLEVSASPASFTCCTSLMHRTAAFLRRECASGPWSLKDEMLSGLAVALAQVPEAIAFSFVAGVDPQIGLQSAFTVGIVTALIGGRPGMISGATAAIAVLLPQLVREHGEGTMFYAIMMYGVFATVFGLLRLGDLVRLLPHPCMIGFVNGLAMLIAIAQVSSFQVPKEDYYAATTMQQLAPEEEENLLLRRHRRRMLLSAANEGGGTSLGAFEVFDTQIRNTQWVSWDVFLWMLAEIVTVMGIMLALPRIAHASSNNRVVYTLLTAIPSSLWGIGIATAFEWLVVRLAAGAETPLVRDVADVKGTFPSIIWISSAYPLPPVREALVNALPTALVATVVGLTESLLTLSLVAEMLQDKGHANMEAIAQGLGNIITGMTGGMGGCAMIGQTVINVKSGGRRRLSGITGALGLLVILLAAHTAINRLPLAALVGVMWMVSFYTFEWRTGSLFINALLPKRVRDWLGSGNRKIRRADAVQVLAVMLVCLFADLAIAIAVGIGLACMSLAWDLRNRIRVVDTFEVDIDADGDDTAPTAADENNNSISGRDGSGDRSRMRKKKCYILTGPLFFASAERFLDFFNPADDPEIVELHMQATEVLDFSGLEALNRLALRYANEGGKELRLKYLSPETRRIAGKAVNLLAHMSSANLTEMTAAVEEERRDVWRLEPPVGMAVARHPHSTAVDVPAAPAGARTLAGRRDHDDRDDVVMRSSREYEAMEIDAREASIRPSASQALLLAVARHPHSTALNKPN